MDDFLNWLKEMISDISLDIKTIGDWKEFIRNFGFIFSFYDKYIRIWNSLNFKWISENINKSDLNEAQTLERIKKIGWLIFILARINILRNQTEIVDCAWMLMATMYVLLINLDHTEITWSIIDECIEEKLTDKQTQLRIFDKLWKFFKVTEIEPVQFSIDLLISMLEKLKEK